MNPTILSPAFGKIVGQTSSKSWYGNQSKRREILKSKPVKLLIKN